MNKDYNGSYIYQVIIRLPFTGSWGVGNTLDSRLAGSLVRDLMSQGIEVELRKNGVSVAWSVDGELIDSFLNRAQHRFPKSRLANV
ncbi:MAG: hypothetical protein IKW19_03705 [Akkermansia sp.]|nr:hypothetical protein [Akkermansia sp.]